MPRSEQTSKRVGTKAAKLLKKKTTPKNTKAVAASALTQMPDKKKPTKKKA